MSAMHESLAAYVATRRALGTKLREPAISLRRFVDLLEREGATHITTSLALRWATEPVGVQPATWARRLSAVRRFATWLSVTDPRTEIPAHRLLNAPHRRPTPHIYTDHEIEEVIDAARRLSSRSELRSLTLATLVGLLASTGLRPGEALALDVCDVNLQDGVLSIRRTKFGKSRFVPVHDSVRVALARYAERRDAILPRRQSRAFFVSRRGSRLVSHTVRRAFAVLSQGIGLRAAAAPRRLGRGPRLQDLRHTFATRRLIEWYRAGRDVDRLMPSLTTYLGHGEVHATYWYVQAVPELLQLATDRMAERAARGAQ